MHKVNHLKIPEIFYLHLRKLKLFTRITPDKNKVLNFVNKKFSQNSLTFKVAKSINLEK